MLTGRLVSCVLVCVALSACSDGSEETVPQDVTPTGLAPTRMASTGGETPAPSNAVVLLGSVTYDVRSESTLAEMAAGYEFVAVLITGVALPFDPRTGYGGIPPVTSAPGDPKDFHPSDDEINRPPGRLFTVYDAEIRRPGETGLNAGDHVHIIQPGGSWENTIYQDPGNPPLEIGREYLLPIAPAEAVTELAGEHLMGPPFVAFLVEEEKTRPLDPEWSWLKAVAELTGKTPEEAITAIIAARQEAPSFAAER